MPTIGQSLVDVVPTPEVVLPEQPNKIVIHPSETPGNYTPILDVVDTALVVKAYGITVESLNVYMVSPSGALSKLTTLGVDLVLDIDNSYVVLAMSGRYVVDKPLTDVILTAEETTKSVAFLAPAYNIVTGGGLVDTYRHTQAAPANPWVINHNLNKDVTVDVLNLAFQVVNAEVRQVSQNQTNVYFSTPQTGYAFIQ